MLTGAGLGVVDGDVSVGVPVVMNGVVGVVPVVINGVFPPVLAPCTQCRSQLDRRRTKIIEVSICPSTLLLAN